MTVKEHCVSITDDVLTQICPQPNRKERENKMENTED